MKLTTLIASLFFSFAGITAFSADCVPKAEMIEIASHFTQFKSITQNDYCFDGSQTSNLLSAIMFMRKTTFTNDMKKSSDQLFSGKFATSWYNYFIGRIDNINIESTCQKGVAAFVYGFGGKTMYLCPTLLTAHFSALDRASIFMHEARHIDGFPHVTCSKGPRQGLQGARDVRITDGGSYAVTVETYAQLAKYATDLNPALKAYARSSAVVYADETFETAVQVQRDTQLLAMTNSRDLNVISLGITNTIQPMGKTPALGHIAMRASHMVLFPEDKTLSAKYLFTNDVGEIIQSAGDAVTEYNSQTPTQKAELVDVHSAAQWNAKVYKTKVVFSCSATTDSVNELSFKNTKAVSILHLNGYDRVSRVGYIMTDSGQLYEFGCSKNATASLIPSSIKLDQNYKRIHKIGEITVGLTSDGHLFEIKSGASTPIKTALDGQIYEIAPRQAYNFFDTNN